MDRIVDSSDKINLALAALSDIKTGVIDLGRYTADASWWWNTGASWPIADFAALLAELHALTENGITVVPARTTQEQNRISIEAESFASLRSGSAYRNRYHFLIIFEDGRISEVREYSDTKHVYEIFEIDPPKDNRGGSSGHG